MVSPKTLKADWGLRMSTDISVQWHMQNEMVCFAYFCEILASYDWTTCGSGPLLCMADYLSLQVSYKSLV